VLNVNIKILPRLLRFSFCDLIKENIYMNTRTSSSFESVLHWLSTVCLPEFVRHLMFKILNYICEVKWSLDDVAKVMIVIHQMLETIGKPILCMQLSLDCSWLRFWFLTIFWTVISICWEAKYNRNLEGENWLWMWNSVSDFLRPLFYLFSFIYYLSGKVIIVCNIKFTFQMKKTAYKVKK
jgi:hypothetical protein